MAVSIGGGFTGKPHHEVSIFLLFVSVFAASFLLPSFLVKNIFCSCTYMYLARLYFYDKKILFYEKMSFYFMYPSSSQQSKVIAGCIIYQGRRNRGGHRGQGPP